MLVKAQRLHQLHSFVAPAAGMTTLITGGLNDNPAHNLRRMFEAFEHSPVNLGILGRAASTVPDPLVRQSGPARAA